MNETFASSNRRSVPSRRQVMAGLVGAAGALALGPGIARAQPNNLRWGSASLGSSGYVILEAMSNVCNKYMDQKSSVFATTGTLENFALMDAEDLEFCHTTSFDWQLAHEGQKPFKAPIKANQMFAYIQWLIPPLVNADSDIHTVTDLAGHSFGAATPAAGSTQMAKLMLHEAGVLDQIDWVYGGLGEVYESFSVGNTDSVYGVFTNGTPLNLITQMELTRKLRALEYSEEVLKKVNARNPGIVIGELTPENWPALDRPIRTPKITGILGSDDRVTPEIGYEVTKTILDNAEEVRSFGVPLAGVNPEDAVLNLLPSFPVNAGAAQYFKEQGTWREELIIAEV